MVLLPMFRKWSWSISTLHHEPSLLGSSRPPFLDKPQCWRLNPFLHSCIMHRYFWRLSPNGCHGQGCRCHGHGPSGPICRLAIAHLGALDQEEQRQVKDLDNGCTWAEIVMGFDGGKPQESCVGSDGISCMATWWWKTPGILRGMHISTYIYIYVIYNWKTWTNPLPYLWLGFFYPTYWGEEASKTALKICLKLHQWVAWLQETSWKPRFLMVFGCFCTIKYRGRTVESPLNQFFHKRNPNLFGRLKKVPANLLQHLAADVAICMFGDISA